MWVRKVGHKSVFLGTEVGIGSGKLGKLTIQLRINTNSHGKIYSHQQ